MLLLLLFVLFLFFCWGLLVCLYVFEPVKVKVKLNVFQIGLPSHPALFMGSTGALDRCAPLRTAQPQQVLVRAARGFLIRKYCLKRERKKTDRQTDRQRG